MTLLELRKVSRRLGRFTSFGKLVVVAMTESVLSGPIGTPVAEDMEQRAARNAAFRAERDRLADYAAIGAQIIVYRTRHGLTQAELARRVGTSHSAISRIERGQHKSSVETLRRIAGALNLRLHISFEPQPEQQTA